jgi:pimeloyl-ACP methyl ester carboxylesterase
MEVRLSSADGPIRAAGLVPTRDVVSLHGLTVAYRRIPGAGIPVVLVHGIGTSGAAFDPVLPLIARSGNEDIAIDLPGHGDSSKERGDYSLGSLASTLRDLLDQLGYDRAVIVGHSLGGGVALQFAYQYPARCAGLVLVCSGGLGREASVLLRAASLPGSEIVLPLLANRRVLAVYGFAARTLSRVGIHPEGLSLDRISVLERFSDPSSRMAFLATLRGVMDLQGQRVSALAKLPATAHLATLLIWGDHDTVIPVEHAHAVHEQLPNSRLVVFPGAGHEPHKFDPERFADLIREFVADSVSPHA